MAVAVVVVVVVVVVCCPWSPSLHQYSVKLKTNQVILYSLEPHQFFQVSPNLPFPGNYHIILLRDSSPPYLQAHQGFVFPHGPQGRYIK